MSDLPTGIEKTYRGDDWRGYRVFVRVPYPGYDNGRIITKRFPKTATLEEMQHWREDQRVDARRRMLEKTPPRTATGFLGDADRYLEAVQAMPQFGERKRHIELWAERFGDRPTGSIASHEIRAQRDEWITRGPKWVFEQGVRVLKPLPLSPQEVNLRLRALENFFTVMFPQQPNPVREVPEAVDTREPIARGQSFALAREVLAHMPDTTRPVKGGAVEAGSLSRIRFEAMFMTGLTHKQIGLLRESHVDWTVPSITPPARMKGRPSRRSRPDRLPQARPLLPAAVPVLRKLFAMGGNCPFSRSSFYKTIKRAVAACNTERAALKLPLLDESIRPYDWTRHTFGTEAYRVGRDLGMVQELLGHSDIRMSAIYARGAVSEHRREVVEALNAHATTGVTRRRGGNTRGNVSPPKPAVSVRTAPPRLVKKLNKTGAPDRN